MYNKQIMALATARWDANTCAASPFLHTYFAPHIWKLCDSLFHFTINRIE